MNRTIVEPARAMLRGLPEFTKTLREFGAPVWVLLQGKKEPRKMETKSRRRIFVGSRNFRFLSLTDDETPPEPIIMEPDVPGEGESDGGTQPTSGNKSKSPR